MEERAVFFLHVMKTAGTTLRQHILANFPPEQVYPQPGVDEDMRTASHEIGHLTGLPPERLRRIRAFSGHFPFVVVDLLGIDAITLTVLRHPVDRTLSYLKGARRNRETHRDLALEEIYEDPLLNPLFIANHQSKLFSMTADDKPTSYLDVIDVDAERLALACRNLERVDIVGLQERFDELVVQLRDRLGWRIGPVSRHKVSNESREVPDSFRRRIAEDNAADMEFYEHALELYERRRRASTVA